MWSLIKLVAYECPFLLLCNVGFYITKLQGSMKNRKINVLKINGQMEFHIWWHKRFYNWNLELKLNQ